MKRTNIHLSEADIKALKAIAKRDGVSYAHVVRRAIKKELIACRKAQPKEK